ncbi:MAG: hypothetical protein U9N33_10480 [Campylobacterota bacterium]|nr:hypothetical protein [Campylobacterota bacterium]
MHSRKHTKMIHEGKYIAEVEVELINTTDNDWAPYLSLDDALKIDAIREALRDDDVSKAKESASKLYLLSELAA